ncbi:MAG: response regulator [Pseudomonadota bacterium]
MNEKLLLVDDEEGIRKVLGLTLADSGYEVRTAPNGEEALKIFREFQPGIVLTDIKMPGIDGIELLRRIKKINPETEVIMITGHGDIEVAVKSLKYEATDFVTKPINDDVLEIALLRAGERLAMRRELKAHTQRLEDLVREKSEKLIRAERLAAVGQVVEGLSSALKGLVDDLGGDINFFNEMPCFVSIHNRELRVLAANQLFLKRLGDRVGAGSWEVYHGPSAKPELCPVARTFESGRGLRVKEVVVGASGTELPVIVHTAPIRGSDGQVELVLEISADITEVRRVQEELWDAQAKYHQLFESAPCYITVLDRDLTIREANRMFKDDFGNQVGTACHQAFRQRAEACPDCPVQATFRDGESHRGGMVAVDKNGVQHELLISTAPIWDSNDEIVEVMELGADITQIRTLQTHLSNLGLLIGSVSHGLKGLLTGLDGGMYMVESGFAKENRRQINEGWNTVQLMVERIRSMVLDILFYAKERDLKWERVNVLGFAEDLALTVRTKARRLGVKLVPAFDHAVDQFEVDPGVARSALLNILENAIDACGEDHARADEGFVVFGVGQDRDNIIFDIRDNGVGMTAETKKNLFSLFFSSKGSRGTGLGLFVSYKIIRQHGGNIEVESEPGQGSRFKITLPKVLPETIKTRGEGHPSKGGDGANVQENIHH